MWIHYLRFIAQDVTRLYIHRSAYRDGQARVVRNHDWREDQVMTDSLERIMIE